MRFPIEEEALFRKFYLNRGWVLIFTVIHTACIEKIYTHTVYAQTQKHGGPSSCWSYHDLWSCQCLACVCVNVVLVHAPLCVWMCVCRHLYALDAAGSLSFQWSDLPLNHTVQWAEREGGGRGSSFPYLSFLSCLSSLIPLCIFPWPCFWSCIIRSWRFGWRAKGGSGGGGRTLI